MFKFILAAVLIIWALCALCKPIEVDNLEDLED